MLRLASATQPVTLLGAAICPDTHMTVSEEAGGDAHQEPAFVSTGKLKMAGEGRMGRVTAQRQSPPTARRLSGTARKDALRIPAALLPPTVDTAKIPPIPCPTFPPAVHHCWRPAALPEMDLALSMAGTRGREAGLLVEDVLSKCSTGREEERFGSASGLICRVEMAVQLQTGAVGPDQSREAATPVPMCSLCPPPQP